MHGFKEWDVICRALECGWQSLLLRAGGIHDVTKWYNDLPERFFLMPNDYHEALHQVRRLPEGADQPVIRWQIRSWAEMVKVMCINKPEMLQRLEPFHIYQPELVQKRFEQNHPPALWLILLRVYQLPNPWQLADEESLGGCRSMVALPPAPFSLTGKPVLDDRRFSRLHDEVETALLTG
ncbi:MAG: DUF1802 family protein [Verrucomicrobiota bacterium]